MNAIPAPGLADPVHDAQRAFRVALEALSRPGRILALGPRETDLPLPTVQALLLLTLTDEDTPVWWQHPAPALQQWLRFHTGARTTRDPQEASFAVVTRAAELPELRSFRAGTAAMPEQSCTLLVELSSLRQGPAIQAHGPGIADRIALHLCGLPEGFWAEWQAAHTAFPQGPDVFFTCGGELLGLPRTTRIGRLEEV